MIGWLADNLFAYAYIALAVICLVIYLTPDWIKRRF